MAMARCAYDLAEASVHTVVSGAVGYSVFWLCTTIDPIAGLSLGLIDASVRRIVEPVFRALEDEAGKLGPRYVLLCRNVAFYAEIILSLAICALFLSPALLTFQVVFYIACAQMISLVLTTVIFNAV